MKRAVLTNLPEKENSYTKRPEHSEAQKNVVLMGADKLCLACAERQTRLVITAVKNNQLRVLVKPNANKTEVLGYNQDKQAVQIAIKSPADKNKANIELIKFLSKELKRKVRIKSGLTSKEKVLSIV